MKIKNLDDLSQVLMEKFKVELRYFDEVKSDIKAINKGSRGAVFLLIIRRAKQGPLFVPEGVAQSLNGKLRGYAKIKPKAMNLRIIYRPIRHDDYVTMEIVAIGPRDHNKAYDMATERVGE